MTATLRTVVFLSDAASQAHAPPGTPLFCTRCVDWADVPPSAELDCTRSPWVRRCPLTQFHRATYICVVLLLLLYTNGGELSPHFSNLFHPSTARQVELYSTVKLLTLYCRLARVRSSKSGAIGRLRWQPVVAGYISGLALRLQALAIERRWLHPRRALARWTEATVRSHGST